MNQSLCGLLGMERPIMSAPIGSVAGPDLVAAVCNAGGYGVIPLWGRGAEEVAAGIDAVRAKTDGNFAVNLNMSFPWADQLQACIDAKVHGVSLFWGLSQDAVEQAASAGLKVLVTVGTAEEAVEARKAGADVIVAQGWEAGGHVWGQVATLALVPSVVDAVDVPVVAAGGIADGRGMAAALMLGAQGVWIGTRFLASKEADIHPDYRQQILAASASQAEWYADLYDVAWENAPHRALRNDTSENWHRSGEAPMGHRPGESDVLGHAADGRPILRYQSCTPVSTMTGDITAMPMWAGQGVSLVHKVQTADEIIDEIYSDAKRVLATAPTLL